MQLKNQVGGLQGLEAWCTKPCRQTMTGVKTSLVSLSERKQAKKKCHADLDTCLLHLMDSTFDA